MDVSEAKSIAEKREMDQKAMEQQKGNFGSTIYLVERKFSSAETTPLEIEVIAGKNTFKLDVGRAVEIVEKRKMPGGR